MGRGSCSWGHWDGGLGGTGMGRKVQNWLELSRRKAEGFRNRPTRQQWVGWEWGPGPASGSDPASPSWGRAESQTRRMQGPFSPHPLLIPTPAWRRGQDSPMEGGICTLGWHGGRRGEGCSAGSPPPPSSIALASEPGGLEASHKSGDEMGCGGPGRAVMQVGGAGSLSRWGGSRGGSRLVPQP